MPRTVLRRLAALTLSVTAALLPTASPPSVGESWRGRAEAALTLAESKPGNGSAFFHAFMAGTYAQLHGWQDPRVAHHLGRVYGQRLASGGYGLPYAWDAFGDGTVNPPTTTYSITVTGQVGRVMLDGYRAGVVPRAEIERLVDVTVRMPRIADDKPGICISYSSRADDTRPGYCVYNIVGSAGKFLADARAAGIVRPGQDALLAGLTQREALGYRLGTGLWPYRDGSAKVQDWNHNAINVEAELTLSPGIGREALTRQMSWGRPPRWIDPMGQVALLQHACGHAAGLLDDFDVMLADPRQTPGLAVQMAYWAAHASRC